MCIVVCLYQVLRPRLLTALSAHGTEDSSDGFCARTVWTASKHRALSRVRFTRPNELRPTLVTLALSCDAVCWLHACKRLETRTALKCETIGCTCPRTQCAWYDRPFVFYSHQTVPLCFPRDHNERKCKESMAFIVNHYGAYGCVHCGTCHTLHCRFSIAVLRRSTLLLLPPREHVVVGCITLALSP